MGLSTEQLIDFLTSLFKHHTMSGVRLHVPVYKADPKEEVVEVAVSRIAPGRPFPSLKVVVRSLPVEDMDGDCQAILDYVEGHLRAMKLELYSEVEPDGQTDRHSDRERAEED